MADSKIINSPLSGPFTDSGLTVDVQIYRRENSKWRLKVVDSEGAATIWDDEFDTDKDANAEFRRCIAEEGIVSLTQIRS